MDEKWQRDIEKILKKKFGGGELAREMRLVNLAISVIDVVEMPTGDMGTVVDAMLRKVSKELDPLAAVYASFQIGAAYEGLRQSGIIRAGQGGD